MLALARRDGPAKARIHLATAQFEAHCDRVTNAGNPEQLLLEGDVHVIYLRNGQNLRIKGERAWLMAC